MKAAGEQDGLWRLSHDSGAHPVRRALARLVWRYEHAPIRELLVGPEGLYLLDGLMLVAIRILLRIPNRTDSAVWRSPTAPYSSGWRGNLIFLAIWAVSITILIAAYRSYR